MSGHVKRIPGSEGLVPRCLNKGTIISICIFLGRGSFADPLKVETPNFST
jgi:hypothetical protein